MAYKVPNPERERAERNRELKRLRKPEESDRVSRATELMLTFHLERDINHVMELAQLVLELDEDPVATLLEAYTAGVADVEDRMERLAMLANVGRWVDTPALEDAARDAGVEVAIDWCGLVSDEIDRMERLGVVERRFDADLRRAVQQRLG